MTYEKRMVGALEKIVEQNDRLLKSNRRLLEELRKANRILGGLIVTLDEGVDYLGTMAAEEVTTEFVEVEPEVSGPVMHEVFPGTPLIRSEFLEGIRASSERLLRARTADRQREIDAIVRRERTNRDATGFEDDEQWENP